jgi:hypothetical protein
MRILDIDESAVVRETTAVIRSRQSAIAVEEKTSIFDGEIHA